MCRSNHWCYPLLFRWAVAILGGQLSLIPDR